MEGEREPVSLGKVEVIENTLGVHDVNLVLPDEKPVSLGEVVVINEDTEPTEETKETKEKLVRKKDVKPKTQPPPTLNDKTLIISSGDISDVDGFYALHKYIETGADVMFVMNYPAYLNPDNSGNNIDASLNEYTAGPEKEDEYLQSILQDDYQKGLPGLGYNYNVYALLQQDKKLGGYISNITDALGGTLKEKVETMRSYLYKYMTLMAFEMCRKVYEEVGMEGKEKVKGTLYFCIGGINSINPFSANAVKVEPFVYDDVVDINTIDFSSWNDEEMDFKEGNVYNCGVNDNYGIKNITKEPDSIIGDIKGGGGWGFSNHLNKKKIEDKDKDKQKPFNFNLKYGNIYIDFNGSMAFFNENWTEELGKVKQNIKATVIMGGVEYGNNKSINTMGPLLNVLNRNPIATMNQLYCPGNTFKFLNFIKNEVKLNPYIITNNVVNEITTEIVEGNVKPTIKVEFNFNINDAILNKKDAILILKGFLSNNFSFTKERDMDSKMLYKISKQYYNSLYTPPTKPFDYFSGIVLCKIIENPNLLTNNGYYLFYDDIFGYSVCSNDENGSINVNGTTITIPNKILVINVDNTYFTLTKNNGNESVKIDFSIPNVDIGG